MSRKASAILSKEEKQKLIVGTKAVIKTNKDEIKRLNAEIK